MYQWANAPLWCPMLDGDADVVIHVDIADYARLIGARTTADPASVTVEGDEELGGRVVATCTT